MQKSQTTENEALEYKQDHMLQYKQDHMLGHWIGIRLTIPYSAIIFSKGWSHACILMPALLAKF